MSQLERALGPVGGVLLALAACASSHASSAPAAPTAVSAVSAAPAPSAQATAAAPAPAPRPSAAAPPASATGLLRGPAPAGASAAEREAAVLQLLQGQIASALPERAADDDSSLDPDWEARILWRLRPELGMRRGPKVRTGEFAVSAGFPNEVVKRIFRQNLGRLRLCYEQQLASKPKLEGKMQLDFIITLAGDIQAPHASAVTLNDTAMFDCVVRSLKDVTFPQPEAPVTVSVPLSFAP